jgi:TolB-like protein
MQRAKTYISTTGALGHRHSYSLNLLFLLLFSVAFLMPLVFANSSFASIDVNELELRQGGSGQGQDGAGGGTLPGIKKITKIAILPFENLANNPEAPAIITGLIRQRLVEQSQITVVSAEEVDDFLLKRRIRYTGGVTRVNIREMGKLMDIDAVLVGSVLAFSGDIGKEVSPQESSTIAVGLAARLVNARDGSILWADTLSYAGNDFAGFFDLGAVTSVDELAGRVVAGLFKDIDNGFKERDIPMAPFEVAEVYPLNASGKAGSDIVVKVRIIPIMDEPAKVRVIIGDQDIVMIREEDSIYEATIRVPSEEGVHTLDIVVTDSSSKEYIASAAGKIFVDNTPPVLGLTLNRSVFSSRKKGFVVFSPRLKSVDEVDEWTLEITDGNGKRIRGDKGYGTIPKGLIWRGETDKGLMVDDGEYKYRFMVRDIAGNEVHMTDTLVVKNNPPSVKVDIKLEDNKIVFTLLHETKDLIKSWKLSLLDKDGKTIKIFSGEGTLPQRLEYPVAEDYDMTRVSYSMVAVDEVGNAFNMTNLIPSKIFRKIPFAEARKSNILEDF